MSNNEGIRGIPKKKEIHIFIISGGKWVKYTPLSQKPYCSKSKRDRMLIFSLSIIAGTKSASLQT